MKLKHTLAILFILPWLVSCSFSLAEDIQPPPGSQQQQVVQVQPTQTTGPLFPVVAPNLAEGAAIYAEKCAPCHGETGMGNGPSASQLTVPVTAIGSPEIARQSTPAQWFTIVTRGNLERFMPPFSSLSDRQRWDVIAFVYSLSALPETLQAGQGLYQEYCARCHGVNGKGDGPDIAGVASRPRDFTDQASMAEKSQADFFRATSEGVSPNMPAFVNQLGEKERWALAAYLHSLAFSSAGAVPSQAALPQAIDPNVSPDELTSSDISEGEPATPGEAFEASSVGPVTVLVTNGTQGGSLEDIEVTLFAFDDMQLTLTQTLTTGKDGAYVFENVELPAGRAFLVRAVHQGANYGSDISVVQPDMAEITLPVVVFETTRDASQLVVDRLHIFFDFIEEGAVKIVELYVISNPTDRAVVAEQPGDPVVSFSIPQGAANLEIQDGVIGERFTLTTDGFADTVAVRPSSGEYQVMFAYDLPYERKLNLDLPINLPANAVVVFLPEAGVKVKSDQLRDNGARDVQGVSYHMYSGDSLSAGSRLQMELVGNPKIAGPTLSETGTPESLLVGLGAFGLTLVLAGVWLYRRNRSANGERETGDEGLAELEPVNPSLEDSGTIIDAIIALDDLYQAGELPEEAYHERRAELKTRLKELMQ